MLFAHDTEVALAAAAALVNTAPEPGDEPEELPDVAALDEFVRTWGWTGERRRDEAELQAVRDLRPRLRRIWEVDEDEVVEIVNGLLRAANALPQLVKHDEWSYHLHATPPAAPLADQDGGGGGHGHRRRRAQQRTAVGCGSALSPTDQDVVVDLSKNRSRRFCEGSCGNRAAVAAYRARKNAARQNLERAIPG